MRCVTLRRLATLLTRLYTYVSLTALKKIVDNRLACFFLGMLTAKRSTIAAVYGGRHIVAVIREELKASSAFVNIIASYVREPNY